MSNHGFDKTSDSIESVPSESVAEFESELNLGLWPKNTEIHVDQSGKSRNSAIKSVSSTNVHSPDSTIETDRLGLQHYPQSRDSISLTQQISQHTVSTSQALISQTAVNSVIQEEKSDHSLIVSSKLTNRNPELDSRTESFAAFKLENAEPSEGHNWKTSPHSEIVALISQKSDTSIKQNSSSGINEDQKSSKHSSFTSQSSTHSAHYSQKSGLKRIETAESAEPSSKQSVSLMSQLQMPEKSTLRPQNPELLEQISQTAVDLDKPEHSIIPSQKLMFSPSFSRNLEYSSIIRTGTSGEQLSEQLKPLISDVQKWELVGTEKTAELLDSQLFEKSEVEVNKSEPLELQSHRSSHSNRYSQYSSQSSSHLSIRSAPSNEQLSEKSKPLFSVVQKRKSASKPQKAEFWDQISEKLEKSLVESKKSSEHSGFQRSSYSTSKHSPVKPKLSAHSAAAEARKKENMSPPNSISLEYSVEQISVHQLENDMKVLFSAAEINRSVGNDFPLQNIADFDMFDLESSAVAPYRKANSLKSYITSSVDGFLLKEDLRRMHAGFDQRNSSELKRSQTHEEVFSKIQAQNHSINELKKKICLECSKFPRSKCEDKQITSLKICLRQEILKLRSFLKDARNLQKKYSKHLWNQIPLATSFEEDSMPLALNFTQALHPCLESDVVCQTEDKSIKKLCLSEGDKTFQGNSKTIIPDEAISSKCSCTGMSSSILTIDGTVFDCYKRTDSHKIELENDRQCLQAELLTPQRLTDSLQKKMAVTQYKPNSTKCRKVETDVTNKLRLSFNCFDVKELYSKIYNLQMELDSLKKDRTQFTAHTDLYFRSKLKETQDSEIKELKERYACLLSEYNKNRAETKDLQQRIEDDANFAASKSKNVQKGEAVHLQERIIDYQEEREEYMILISEQNAQLEDYRQKYFCAQQKVEEQKLLLEKFEKNNKEVENQINLEIHTIKEKFQEKLGELSHFPKLLENEQVKLSRISKEKVQLEQKLRIVCRELKSVKAQTAIIPSKLEEVKESDKLEQEIASLRKIGNALKTDNNILSEKLLNARDELDCLRSGSAKIIAQAKERIKSQKEFLQYQINQLEKDLAHCRASACVTLKEKEAVIAEMQAELKCLAISFNTAQKQIKSLREIM